MAANGNGGSGNGQAKFLSALKSVGKGVGKRLRGVAAGAAQPGALQSRQESAVIPLPSWDAAGRYSGSDGEGN
jgi:hypothetical protein